MKSTEIRGIVATFITNNLGSITVPAGKTTAVEESLTPRKESEKYPPDQITFMVYPMTRRSARFGRTSHQANIVIRVAIRSSNLGFDESTRRDYEDDFVDMVEELEELMLLNLQGVNSVQTSTGDRDAVSRELLIENQIAVSVIDLEFTGIVET